MQCECDNPDCVAVISIPLDAYREHRRDELVFLTAPRHRLADATPTRQEIDYWAQRRPTRPGS
jgi:hypothetical protein